MRIKKMAFEIRLSRVGFIAYSARKRMGLLMRFFYMSCNVDGSGKRFTAQWTQLKTNRQRAFSTISNKYTQIYNVKQIHTERPHTTQFQTNTHRVYNV